MPDRSARSPTRGRHAAESRLAAVEAELEEQREEMERRAAGEAELRQRHAVLLRMFGAEKEQTEGLRADLDELRAMHRQQAAELARLMAEAS